MFALALSNNEDQSDILRTLMMSKLFEIHRETIVFFEENESGGQHQKVTNDNFLYQMSNQNASP